MNPAELHARVSPSKLQRILDCPGSFKAAQAYVSEDSGAQSSYAAEGTLLHHAVERYLGLKLSGPVSYDIVEPTLNQEQCDAVDDCLDYLKNILRTIDGPYELHIEKRVYLQGYSPVLHECDGTCDIIVTTLTRLIVIDWKFGQGVPVYVELNDQLYAYAAGALIEIEHRLTIEDIEVHVVQPRLNNFDMILLSYAQLMLWMNARVIPGLKQAYSDDAPFVPGTKQCRWCPVSMCRARINFANQTAADVFGAHQKLPSSVSLEEAAKIVGDAPIYEACIKDLRTYLFRQLEQGVDVPGFKLVRGRSIRQWVDPVKAEEFLEEKLDYEDMYTMKMISISQAEKKDRTLKKDEDFQALIVKPPGKITMTVESDKRPAVDVKTAAQKFGDTL